MQTLDNKITTALITSICGTLTVYQPLLQALAYIISVSSQQSNEEVLIRPDLKEKPRIIGEVK